MKAGENPNPRRPSLEFTQRELSQSSQLALGAQHDQPPLDESNDSAAFLHPSFGGSKQSNSRNSTQEAIHVANSRSNDQGNQEPVPAFGGIQLHANDPAPGIAGYLQANQAQNTGQLPYIVDEFPEIDTWSSELNDVDSGWLLGGDFDSAALNASISATLSNSNFQWPNGLADTETSSGISCSAEAPPEGVYSMSTPAITGNWPTKPTVSATSQNNAVPVNADQNQVDDTYRLKLSSRLQPKLREGMLPSSQFLVC